MARKDFIRTSDGKVLLLTSNVAKMNVFEYLWYNAFYLYEIIDIMKNCFVDIWEGIKASITMVINLITILLLPIALPIKAYLEIKAAKEEMSDPEEIIQGKANF